MVHFYEDYSEQPSSLFFRKPIITPKKIRYKPKDDETMVYTTTKNGTKRFVGIAKNKQATVSSDNRSSYQKNKDQKYSLAKIKTIQNQKIQEEGLENMNAFFKLFSPSTYVGAAGNATIGNGTFMGNILTGTGSGDESVDLAIDLLTPGAFSKAFKYGTKEGQFLKNTITKSVPKIQRTIRKVLKNITAQKRINLLEEKLNTQNLNLEDLLRKNNKHHVAFRDARAKEFWKDSGTHIFNDDILSSDKSRLIDVNWDKINTENANKFSKKHGLGVEFEEQPFKREEQTLGNTQSEIVKRPAFRVGYTPDVKTGPYKTYRFRDGRLVEGTTNLNTNTSTYETVNFDPNVTYIPINKINLQERTVSGIDALKDTLKDNIEYLQETIPGFKPFGSSVGVAEDALVHNTHDIDGYITRKTLKLLLDKGVVEETVPKETYLYKIGGGKYGDAGNVDLNILAIDQDGKVLNKRTREMYELFFPFQYQRLAREVRSGVKPYILALDKDGNILTEELLLDSYDPLTKTILDSGQIDFTRSGKQKHAGRFLEYLTGDNPEAVHKALLYEAMKSGENRYLFPKLNFGSPEDNAEILQSIGFTGDVWTIAKNPAKMQNVLDYWLLSARRNFRSFGAGDINGNNKSIANIYRNATDWNASTEGSGGHASGGGLNTTIDGASNYPGELAALVLPKIRGLLLITDPKLAIHIVNMANGIDNPVEVTDGILKMFGIDPGTVMPNENLLSVLPNSGEAAKHTYEQVALKYGINALTGGSYGKGTYSGIIRKLDPNVDAVGILLNDENAVYPSWSARMKATRKSKPYIGTHIGKPTDYRPAQNMQEWYDLLFTEKDQRLRRLLNINSDRLQNIFKIKNNYLNKKNNFLSKTFFGVVPASLLSTLSYFGYNQYRKVKAQDYYNDLIRDYGKSLYNTLDTQREKLGEYGSGHKIPGNDYRSVFVYPNEVEYILDNGQEGADSITRKKMRPIKIQKN